MLTDEHWRSRNVIRGFGGMFASSRLRALLLNIGLPKNDRAEVNLETSVGGRKSVADDSAEVRFSVGYDYTL